MKRAGRVIAWLAGAALVIGLVWRWWRGRAAAGGSDADLAAVLPGAATITLAKGFSSSVGMDYPSQAKPSQHFSWSEVGTSAAPEDPAWYSRGKRLAARLELVRGLAGGKPIFAQDAKPVGDKSALVADVYMDASQGVALLAKWQAEKDKTNKGMATGFNRALSLKTFPGDPRHFQVGPPWL